MTSSTSSSLPFYTSHPPAREGRVNRCLRKVDKSRRKLINIIFKEKHGKDGY
jgi:hypothetical protein